ncbi:MAG TPA: nucleoside-triphosphatase [bacterium]|nr:nucleoside-triphosphatase [bacterium]HPP86958.1 nucleoside-triphosphatase [bacterium]
MKICVQGNKKTGKTTFIKNNYPKNVVGLITRRTRAGVIIGYMRDHKILKWKKCGKIVNNKMTAIIEVFENFGVEIINKLMKVKNKTIVIDEIGFLELQAPKYCAALKKLLNEKNDIIAALRNESNELIDYFKNNVNKIYLTDKIKK